MLGTGAPAASSDRSHSLEAADEEEGPEEKEGTLRSAALCVRGHHAHPRALPPLRAMHVLSMGDPKP